MRTYFPFFGLQNNDVFISVLTLFLTILRIEISTITENNMSSVR